MDANSELRTPALGAAPEGANSEPSTHVLAAREVAFAYHRDRPVLRGVSLQAEAGKLLSILGPNGSGKTTLLRCLLGRLKPSGGEILLDGRALARHSPRSLARLMAYVPQTPQSAFDFSAGEIVLMGRLAHTGMLGLAGRRDVEVARAAMDMTGTSALADRTLEELSGGEVQRVMIARALAQQPRVMLLDEPTSHLDLKNQLMIYRMMQRLARDWSMAVICVSHDVNIAAAFADELVLMRDGGIRASGKAVDVINVKTLSEVYDVTVELVAVPDSAIPIVIAR